jgi:signal transduction histidine kinase
MSDTASRVSRRRRPPPDPHLVDALFAVLVLLLLLVMIKAASWETVPYHVIFVSLAVVYGFRVWSVGTTGAVLVTLTVVTGGVLVQRWSTGRIEAEELSEIVLMPMILGVMAWHARRRALSQRQLEELAETERGRRLREQEFLRDCSHALRTPLTVARGHVELFLETDDPVERQNDADIVLGELDRMNRLASRLLAIADVERPDALAIRRLDAASVVLAAANRWEASVHRAWATEVGGAAWVNGDEERLSAALDALIDNAIHSTRDGDAIRLACESRPDRVTLAVADSGPGFAPGEEELAFQRFWRAPRYGEVGTGLGLSYARAVADAHGGGVTAGRSREGGAYVGIWLPAAGRSIDEILAPTPAHLY